MCADCKAFFVKNAGPVPLREFINRFEFPILVVNSNVEATQANDKALDLLGKHSTDVGGALAGNIMECAHARLPGGCGRTVHCKGCAIRNSVTETYKTGKLLIDVDAYQDIRTPKGTRRTLFKVSTVKQSESVLLRIIPA